MGGGFKLFPLLPPALCPTPPSHTHPHLPVALNQGNEGEAVNKKIGHAEVQTNCCQRHKLTSLRPGLLLLLLSSSSSVVFNVGFLVAQRVLLSCTSPIPPSSALCSFDYTCLCTADVVCSATSCGCVCRCSCRWCIGVCVLLNQPADTRSVQFRYQALRALLNLKLISMSSRFTLT